MGRRGSPGRLWALPLPEAAALWPWAPALSHEVDTSLLQYPNGPWFLPLRPTVDPSSCGSEYPLPRPTSPTTFPA